MSDTILIVDDEKNIRRTLRMILEGEGFEVLEAGSAEEGLPLIDERAVDLVVLDVRLPGMTGVEFVRQVKHDPRFADVPVLLMSAYGDPARHAADGFLAKPFDVENLTAEVQRLLCA